MGNNYSEMNKHFTKKPTPLALNQKVKNPGKNFSELNEEYTKDSK